VFTVRYTETADACFAPLTPEQRRSIIRIVARIQDDPSLDYLAAWWLGAMYPIYLDPRDTAGHWVISTSAGTRSRCCQ
jgi:hypothetical protein